MQFSFQALSVLEDHQRFAQEVLKLEPDSWDRTKVESNPSLFYHAYFMDQQKLNEVLQRSTVRIQQFNVKVTRQSSDKDPSASSRHNREKLEAKFKVAISNLYHAFEDAFQFESSEFIEDLSSHLVKNAVAQITGLFVSSRCRTCYRGRRMDAAWRLRRFETLLPLLSEVPAESYRRAEDHRAHVLLDKTSLIADGPPMDKFRLGFTMDDRRVIHSVRSGGVSPWNFPLLPVRKKNGKWRWVVDFRALNSVTRKDSFPIPNIIELLSYLRKSKIFTSLDLAQAFHSIPVREVDREKLSFCALDKFYQFCRMPFGLTSAPNTWARLVTQVLQEIPKSQLIVFFDDLLIHSPDLTTHVETLKQVFVLLQKAGLRLNMEKTDWVKKEVKFLGHLISDQGVSVPPEFSQIIKDWPLPKTLKDLRAFLGKCNYYRSHFQNFAIIASPLMAHLKGASESSRKLNLEQDPKAIASFEALKQLLMSPQLLAYPDFDSTEPFIVDTDYSHEGLGNVLSQVQDGIERPISFNARRLKPSESQYASHKGELLALIFAIDTYKFFLTGRKFLVRTDNSALSWLKTQKNPKGILMRWLRIISTYDFDIQHRAGTKHGNADSLSRTSHAPFLSEKEAQEILADDQILLLGEAPEDDGQESEEEDSLSESRRYRSSHSSAD